MKTAADQSEGQPYRPSQHVAVMSARLRDKYGLRPLAQHLIEPCVAVACQQAVSHSSGTLKTSAYSMDSPTTPVEAAPMAERDHDPYCLMACCVPCTKFLASKKRLDERQPCTSCQLLWHQPSRDSPIDCLS